MRILLTGSSGMVGRNILEHPGAAANEFLKPSSTELNLCDPLSVRDYLKTYRPDMIIHAAGRVGGIQANIREPLTFFVENLDMARNLIVSAKELEIHRLLNLGSSCMYPRNAVNPLREDSVLTGQLEPTNEGYALAKIAAARLCEYINRQDGSFQYKTIIPCNLYGRWDKFDPSVSHMIPAVIRKVHDAKVYGYDRVEIWGDGTARREFMYSGDLADFIIHAINTFDSLPQLMNVGLGHDYTISEYYKTISDIVGYKGTFEYDLTKPTGMSRKLVDISRQSQFGWSPSTSLNRGIELTYKHFLEIKGEQNETSIGNKYMV